MFSTFMEAPQVGYSTQQLGLVQPVRETVRTFQRFQSYPKAGSPVSQSRPVAQPLIKSAWPFNEELM